MGSAYILASKANRHACSTLALQMLQQLTRQLDTHHVLRAGVGHNRVNRQRVYESLARVHDGEPMSSVAELSREGFSSLGTSMTLQVPSSTPSVVSSSSIHSCPGTPPTTQRSLPSCVCASAPGRTTPSRPACVVFWVLEFPACFLRPCGEFQECREISPHLFSVIFHFSFFFFTRGTCKSVGRAGSSVWIQPSC